MTITTVASFSWCMSGAKDWCGGFECSEELGSLFAASLERTLSEGFFLINSCLTAGCIYFVCVRMRPSSLMWHKGMSCRQAVTVVSSLKYGSQWCGAYCWGQCFHLPFYLCVSCQGCFFELSVISGLQVPGSVGLWEEDFCCSWLSGWADVQWLLLEMTNYSTGQVRDKAIFNSSTVQLSFQISRFWIFSPMKSKTALALLIISVNTIHNYSIGKVFSYGLFQHTKS